LNLNRSNISESAKRRINNKFSENVNKLRNGEHITQSNDSSYIDVQRSNKPNTRYATAFYNTSQSSQSVSQMNRSSYANRLMTELPFTQNHDIKTKLLRASELKEIGKLQSFLNFIVFCYYRKIGQNPK